MRIAVRFKLPSGDEVELEPGDLVGRMPRCDLRIEDPRVSEAHALVSLRGTTLKLLALRGRISVGGKPVTEVALAADQRILLGGFYPLIVTSLSVPDAVLALVIADQVIPVTGVIALKQTDSGLEHKVGFDPNADFIAWAADNGLRVRLHHTTSPDDGLEVVLLPGETATLDGREVGATLVDATTHERSATVQPGRFDVGLHLVGHYDTVHIQPHEGAAIVLDGFPARLITELAELDTPVAWEAIARKLWPDTSDLNVLRQRWDQTTSRVRKRLRDGRVRTDLVRSNRGGLVELYLGPGDTYEDRS
jgi:hypothetical protein